MLAEQKREISNPTNTNYNKFGKSCVLKLALKAAAMKMAQKLPVAIEVVLTKA